MNAKAITNDRFSREYVEALESMGDDAYAAEIAHAIEALDRYVKRVKAADRLFTQLAVLRDQLAVRDERGFLRTLADMDQTWALLRAAR